MLQCQKSELISAEELEGLVGAAAKAASYEEGFGLRGCDLSKPIWWAVYVRQSLDQQSHNNRLPEYLFTCAKEARKLGVVVPIEYILYDAGSGEHLERPAMIYLRHELIPGRRIGGVIFPALDRVSREPIHIGVLEFEMDYCGVGYHYADAPSGSDPMSQMVRQNLAHAAKFVKLANRKNNRGGNVGRALKGMAPAFRAAYGYTYRAEYREEAGRRTVMGAWWEVDSLGPDGEPTYGSPAWVVQQLFQWVGEEQRTLYWVAHALNEPDLPTASGSRWTPSKLQKLVRQACYKGEHVYNAHLRVPDPSRPLGDITAEIKRTRLQKKPESEWVYFKVPLLVSEELWRKANNALTIRGRGRGKEGKCIQALLRGRIFCPRCGRPMVVRRNGRQKRVYYHCSAYFRPWLRDGCSFRKFIPGTWDDIVWGDLSSWLRDDAWVEKQLVSEQSQDENVAKLIRLEQFKVSQAQAKIAKVQEGFEGGVYNLDDARRRIAQHQATIAKAEMEIQRLRESMNASAQGTVSIEAMREELKALRDRNVDEADFEEKLDIISKLGIKVYPSEDLSTMRVACQLNLQWQQPGKERNGFEMTESRAIGERGRHIECGKVSFAPLLAKVSWLFTSIF